MCRNNELLILAMEGYGMHPLFRVSRRLVVGLVGIALGLSVAGSFTPAAQAQSAIIGQTTTISAGDLHSVALAYDGSVWAWGANNYQQIGDGTSTERHNPVKILSDVTSISAGAVHTLALKTDGSVWAWGYNGNGELGIGTRATKNKPVEVIDGGVVAVAVGDHHSMAIKSDGSLWVWGSNFCGQIGNGSSADALNPVKIMDNVTAIAGGYNYSLAVQSDGTLWAWGADANWGLDVCGSAPQSKPVKIMSNVVSVASANDTSFAIKTDGSLWGWGTNVYGELGDGNSMELVSNPIEIISSGVVSVSTSGETTLAIKNDQTLWAWGLGPLGNGTKTTSTVPVKIASDVKEASVGDYQRLIRKTDGTVWGWGNNLAGMVGDRTTTTRLSPVVVMGPDGFQYKMTFDPNGGKVSPASKSVTLNAAFSTLPTPTRSGYTFAGWYSDASGGTKYTSTTKLTVAKDVTVYAHWTSKKYTVTFNANGGSTPKASGKITKSKSVSMGKAYGTLPTSSRTGYSFTGWWTAKSGGTQITSDALVASAKNVTVYAQWKAKQYTVNLNPRSGVLDPGSVSVTVTYNKTYGGLPTPTRAGYSFKGWWTKASGGVRIYSSTKVKITSSQTLYAHWSAKKYTVTFDANGGSTPKVGTAVKRSKTVTFAGTFGALPKSSLKGYTFAGWFTDPTDGARVTSKTKVDTPSSVTLYAHWVSND